MFNFVSKYLCPVFSIYQSFNHVSHLTTFNVDRIGLPGYSMSSCHNETVAEIVKLLKKYHHKKWTTFRGPKWRDIEQQLDMMKHQPSVAIGKILQHLQDPHARYYEPDRCLSFYESTKGISLESGLRVTRKVYLSEIVSAVKFGSGIILSSFLSLRSSRVSMVVCVAVIFLCWSPMRWIASCWKLSNFVFGSILFFSLAAIILPIAFPVEVSTVVGSFEVIRLGDRICSINGRPVFWWWASTLNTFLGNKVHISSIDKKEADNLNITFIRKFQRVNNLGWDYRYFRECVPWDYYHCSNLKFHLLKHQTNVGYICLPEFHEYSRQDFQQALVTLRMECQQQRNQTLNGIIIDLRGNSGGSLVQALEIAALFLGKNKPLLQISGSLFFETIWSINSCPDSTTGILFLVDDRSASASEVLIEALCANNRATSLGKKSFGKNTAQVFLALSDGSGISFTIREFRGPFRRSLSNGVTIDIHEPNSVNLAHIRYDITNNRWCYRT